MAQMKLNDNHVLYIFVTKGFSKNDNLADFKLFSVQRVVSRSKHNRAAWFTIKHLTMILCHGWTCFFVPLDKMF